MLRIIEQLNGNSLTFRLAGKLVKEWTPELERCWQQALTTPPPRLCVDLTEVTFVDATGKRLLAAMATTGVELLAADVVMNALVEQIAEGKVFDEAECELSP